MNPLDRYNLLVWITRFVTVVGIMLVCCMYFKGVGEFWPCLLLSLFAVLNQFCLEENL